jgi:hypothetical protein
MQMQLRFDFTPKKWLVKILNKKEQKLSNYTHKLIKIDFSK